MWMVMMLVITRPMVMSAIFVMMQFGSRIGFRSSNSTDSRQENGQSRKSNRKPHFLINLLVFSR
jgi:hypothetical protein